MATRKSLIFWCIISSVKAQLRKKNFKVVDGWLGGWVAGWLTDNNATPWPILQAERLARISADLSLQDGPSVAIYTT